MLIVPICRKYDYLLSIGVTYTCEEFANLVKPFNRSYARQLKRSKFNFRRTIDGIILDYQGN